MLPVVCVSRKLESEQSWGCNPGIPVWTVGIPRSVLMAVPNACPYFFPLRMLYCPLDLVIANDSTFWHSRLCFFVHGLFLMWLLLGCSLYICAMSLTDMKACFSYVRIVLLPVFADICEPLEMLLQIFSVHTSLPSSWEQSNVCQILPCVPVSPKFVLPCISSFLLCILDNLYIPSSCLSAT